MVRPSRTVTQLDTTDLTRGDGQWNGFGAAVVRAGGEPYADVTAIRDVPATPAVAQWLAVPIGTIVLLRERVHGVVEGGNRVPFEVASTWITMPVVEAVPAVRERDTGPGGITRRITEAGYAMQYEDVSSARHPSAAEQEYLGVDADHPVLDVWRRSYDQDGRVIKASNRVIDPMRHQPVYRY